MTASADAVGEPKAALPEDTFGACVLSAAGGLVRPQSALPEGVTLQAVSAFERCAPRALKPTGEDLTR